MSGSMMFLLVYVLPKFSSMFADLGRALPLSAQIILGLSQGIRSYWWVGLLGVFALALAAQGRDLARPAVAGVASAIGLVAFLAVLSRLHPAWFPPNHVQEVFPGSARRLSYPLDSTNAVGSFMAIGLPLGLALAVSARTIAGQALAAAGVPVMGLCLFLTASRGAWRDYQLSGGDCS